MACSQSFVESGLLRFSETHLKLAAIGEPYTCTHYKICWWQLCWWQLCCCIFSMERSRGSRICTCWRALASKGSSTRSGSKGELIHNPPSASDVIICEIEWGGSATKMGSKACAIYEPLINQQYKWGNIKLALRRWCNRFHNVMSQRNILAESDPSNAWMPV